MNVMMKRGGGIIQEHMLTMINESKLIDHTHPEERGSLIFLHLTNNPKNLPYLFATNHCFYLYLQMLPLTFCTTISWSIRTKLRVTPELTSLKMTTWITEFPPKYD